MWDLRMKLTSATSIFSYLKLILQCIPWIINPIQNGFFSLVLFFKCDLISLISKGREEGLPYCNLLHHLRDYRKQVRLGIHQSCALINKYVSMKGVCLPEKDQSEDCFAPWGCKEAKNLRLNREQCGKALINQARNSMTLRTRRKSLLKLKTQTHNFPLHLWTWRPPHVSYAYSSQVCPLHLLPLPRAQPSQRCTCQMSHMQNKILENDPVCKGHRRIFGELTQPDP